MREILCAAAAAAAAAAVPMDSKQAEQQRGAIGRLSCCRIVDGRQLTAELPDAVVVVLGSEAHASRGSTQCQITSKEVKKCSPSCIPMHRTSKAAEAC